MGLASAAFLLLAILQCTLACPSTFDPDNELSDYPLVEVATHEPMDTDANAPNLTKRWHSILELPTSLNAPYIYPWPKTCDDPPKQPIYICFKNLRSEQTLKSTVDAAINIWIPAMMNPDGERVSSMTIEYHPNCLRDSSGNVLQYSCQCSSVGAYNALVISDDSQKGSSCVQSTTLGHHYVPPGEPNDPWRHKLSFCDIKSAGKDNLKKAVGYMAHELGHAMGLVHEQQRDDRDEFIRFNCRRLRGWADVAAEVNAGDAYGVFKSLGRTSTNQKMEALCSSWTMARKYPKIAGDIQAFLKMNQFDTGDYDAETRKNNKQYSNDFDYDSIMIYPSTAGGTYRSGSGKPVLAKHLVMERLDGKNNGQVFMGGSESGEDMKITEGDIARIATLYPIDTEANQRAREGNAGQDWSLKSGGGVKARDMRVKIRGGPPIVINAPRSLGKRDEL